MAITQTHGGTVEHPATWHMSAIDWIAMALLIVGGLNWGLVGVLGYDLVAAIFGDMSPLSRIVYALVGVSALWCIYTATKIGSRD